MQYSIIRSKQIEPISIRLDAEFYRPIFIKIEKQLMHGNWDYLKNLSTSIKSFGAYSLCNLIKYKKYGIPFLRCKDIKEGVIDLSDVLYIDHNANKLLWKSEVKPDTVLLTMSGTVGNSAISTEDATYPINSNQDIAKITTNKRLNPFYFSIFLQSSHGKIQLSRLPIGSVQQHIFLWQLNKIIVPLFVESFQLAIENLYKLALSSIKEADLFNTQAQDLLLSELGLTDWQPKRSLFFIKNYSDTQQAERIDAEYFQPKYEEIVRAIKNYAGGWDTLENLVHLNEQRYNPKDTQKYKYIELANIANNGEISGSMIDTGKDLPSRARRRVSTGDIIVSSIEGSLSSIAMIEKEYHQALCSTGFHVVNSKNFNSETLLILMKSIPGQLQLKKGCSGTILTAVNKDELNKVILPITTEQKQTEIQQKVRESFKLRKQSKHLLECAKRAVEMAIEQDEKTAINWLKEQTAL